MSKSHSATRSVYKGHGTYETVTGPVPAAEQLSAARLACDRLKDARDLLKLSNSPKAAEKVRRALKSAEGAVRHCEGRVTDERYGR